MADGLVSIVLSQLDTIGRQVEQEVRLVIGVENEVQRLSRTFRTIQRVLADAEQRQLMDNDVTLWLDGLRDICYEMDDVLDEWDTKIKFPGYFFCLSKVCLRRHIALRITILYQQLEGVVLENETRLRLAVSDPGSNQQFPNRYITTAFFDRMEVQGRDQDRNNLINMLLRESSGNLHVISVVGMGGLGKTTLAQLVYNDDIIMDNFSKRIWVCVSDPFDLLKIAKAILESLTNQASASGELQFILQQINQCLERNRFLLVLDDVWNEDRRRWESLRDGLVNCGSGRSRILVTTRNSNVASTMGCTQSDIFQLGLLSVDACWSIFRRIALLDNDERRQFEGIGRSIVETHCNGLPLVAKTLGGLLCSQYSIEQWESVLTSEVWQVEINNIAREPLSSLWLSYLDLRSEVKQCFRYCAVFPKDHLIVKDELIKLWMSQGYLMAGTNMEVIGEQYFQNLANRFFFQDFSTDFLDRTTCKMHDIVHDFAQFITRNECSGRKGYHPTEQTVEHSPSSTNVLRHLFVEVIGCNDSLPTSYFSGFQKLHSLSIDGRSSWIERDDIGAALPFIFKELTCLRCLSLRWCKISKIPSTINSLKHLRFLDLSGNLFQNLPASVCKLYNLQTLFLEYCTKLMKLPKKMGKLVNLRHLSISYSSFDIFLPKGIGSLTSLRTLNYFMIGHGRDSCCLVDLARLNNLSGTLVIRNLGENAADVIEAREALLNEKGNLSRLELSFCGEENAVREDVDEELIKALNPPPALEALYIYGYKCATIFQEGFNHWMPILDQLKTIILHKCFLLDLPPLGQLRFLEILEIKEIHGVKTIEIEFLGLQYIGNNIPDEDVAFPMLLQFILSDMSSLEEWGFEREDGGNTVSTEFGMSRMIRSTYTGEDLRMKEETKEGDSSVKKISTEAKRDVHPSGFVEQRKMTKSAYAKEGDDDAIGLKEITGTEAAKKNVGSSGLIEKSDVKKEKDVCPGHDVGMKEKIRTEIRKDVGPGQDVGMKEKTSTEIKKDFRPGQDVGIKEKTDVGIKEKTNTEMKKDFRPGQDVGMKEKTRTEITQIRKDVRPVQDVGMKEKTSTKIRKDVGPGHDVGMKEKMSTETTKNVHPGQDVGLKEKTSTERKDARPGQDVGLKEKTSTETRKDARPRQDVGMKEKTSTETIKDVRSGQDVLMKMKIEEDDAKRGDGSGSSTKKKGDAVSSIVIMPRITHLSVKNCPILKALPDQILHRTTLKHLEIDGSDLLRERYNKKIGEDWHKISHIRRVLM